MASAPACAAARASSRRVMPQILTRVRMVSPEGREAYQRKISFEKKNPGYTDMGRNLEMGPFLNTSGDCPEKPIMATISHEVFREP
jgi:hypothetical protein